ncbi:MAG: hypothetical protein RMX68_029045 [Aulosira sp. ZfuVER01]|nr:hypothetical protein [Aulosira sp. ZfuVER01]MDZ8002131.1 hypothetical protein [Aulosira sp. DedVER01a]MDZ8052602.1 hypothetical protein [Aulosira sp. ZfuCHP01]
MIARIDIGQAKSHSRYKNAAPYSALGLINFHDAIENKFSNNEGQIELTEEGKKLLTAARLEIQQAINIEYEPSYYPEYYWNLGLILLWQCNLEETYNAWQKAFSFALKYKENEICKTVYEYALNILNNKNTTESSNTFNYKEYLSKIQTRLNEAGQSSKTGRIEMMLDDLYTIQEAANIWNKKQLLNLEELGKIIEVFKDKIGKHTKPQNNNEDKSKENDSKVDKLLDKLYSSYSHKGMTNQIQHTK